jgi:hypothetical protein
MGNSNKKKKQLSFYDENLVTAKHPTIAIDNNYKQYFDLIKIKQRKFYEENSNSKFNISISLDKRDFHSIALSRRISIEPSQKFIYWKDYLLKYLSKQAAKGYQWSSDLIE